MNKKRILFWSVLLIALSAGLYVAARRVMTDVLANVDLNLHPFVSEQAHYIIKDGAEIVVNKETVARTRNGAAVHSGTMYTPSGKAFSARKVELPDGFAALVLDSIKAKSSGHKATQNTAQMKSELMHPPAGCLYPNETADGEEVLRTQTALRVQNITADGLMRFTYWRLPRFACATVQSTVERRTSTSAPWQVTSGSHLISFTETDPAPDLFEGFTAYKEMKPSDIFRAYAAGFDPATAKTCSNCRLKGEAAADAAYAQANK